MLNRFYPAGTKRQIDVILMPVGRDDVNTTSFRRQDLLDDYNVSTKYCLYVLCQKLVGAGAVQNFIFIEQFFECLNP